jgi:hypothetical protein
MLEQMRRQGASIFIYLIFSLLIVIMVYGLAPSNRGDGSGCTSSSTSAVTVDGQDVSQSAWLVSYQGNSAPGRQRTYVALDFLIRRELLAQAAGQLGLRANGAMVDEEIKRGNFFLGGQRIDVRKMFFAQVGDDQFFDINQVKSWASQLNVSLGSYREEQVRGLQAALMADLLKSSVRVSRNEALADFLYDNNTVTYDAVSFDPAKYAAAIKLSDADIKRYLDSHGDEVSARYKADERTYKAVKPQLQIQEIFIPKAYPEPAKPAAADDKKADDKKADDKTAKADDKKADDKKPADDKKAAKADDKKPANPRGLLPEIAKPKLEDIRAQIAAGKLKFADAQKLLAADSSDDAPADNGDRGWRSADNAALGDKAVNDAVKALKPGEMTPVIATDRGAYLVMVTDKREGDLSYDQVKTEIAASLAKDTWSKEAAKREALAALTQVQSGKKLSELFEKEAPKFDIEQFLNDPNIPESQKQQIRQLMQQKQMLQHGAKHGALETHEVDVPVGWFASGDEPSGSAAPAATGSAAPATGSSAPATGSAAPAAGSAAPAAGSAAPAAAPAKPATPAPAIEASKDVLPAFGEVAKPKLATQGPTPRQEKMPGIGADKHAAAALFDELAPGEAAKTLFEGADGAYVLVQLTARNEPKVEDFDKTADAEIARMQDERGRALLQTWLKDRCEALTKAGKIRPARQHILETDDKGNPAPTVYHPCMYFDQIGRG